MSNYLNTRLDYNKGGLTCGFYWWYTTMTLIFIGSRRVLHILLPVVTLGCFFNGVWHIYGRHIAYSKKTMYVALLGLLSSLVNIMLNAIFISEYGYKAAAYTTLFSFVFLALMSVIVTKYIINIYPVTIKLIIYPVIYMPLTIAVFNSLEISNMNLISKLSIKVLCLLSFVGLLILAYIKSRFVSA